MEPKSGCPAFGDCPDFRVNENGTVPFRLDFDDFDRPDAKILTSPVFATQ